MIYVSSEASGYVTTKPFPNLFSLIRWWWELNLRLMPYASRVALEEETPVFTMFRDEATISAQWSHLTR